MMPQWDFLDFLAASGRRYRGFHLMMNTTVTDLIRSGEWVVGLRATTDGGPVEISADLVIGADGRRSTVRELAGFPVKDKGSPIDVSWMHLPRSPTDPTEGPHRGRPPPRHDQSRRLLAGRLCDSQRHGG
jgi:2-polyprenyl-6-methoxyphenol hydroxylase-like FAD-dependent oxidoreductase